MEQLYEENTLDYRMYLHEKGKFFYFKNGEAPNNAKLDNKLLEAYMHVKLKGKYLSK